MDAKEPLLLSVSRRTDVPAYFGDWFSSRLERGWVDVRNPFNQSLKRISLLPEDVLGYVFWSKNPLPFNPVLDRILLSGPPVLYHVTITGLPREMEPHIPDESHVIRGMHELASRIPCSAITWRFDPTLPMHGKQGDTELRERFLRLSEKIGKVAGRVALSIVDPYRKIRKRMGRLTAWNTEWSLDSANKFYEWVQKETPFSGKAFWCAEPELPSQISSACIDREILIAQGVPADGLVRSATRPGCSCMKAVDIGAYDTCLGGCVYCYAVQSHEKVRPFPV